MASSERRAARAYLEERCVFFLGWVGLMVDELVSRRSLYGCLYTP